MDCCSPQPPRRHNPVDSICRKLQTIQWCGEREPNSPFQIPKFSSSSYDSPQCGLRHNVETILKKGARHREPSERAREGARETATGLGTQSSAAAHEASPAASAPLSAPCSHTANAPTPANLTYTIMSTLGERRGVDGSHLRPPKMWQRCCSTPTTQSKDSPDFTFVREQHKSETHNGSPPGNRTFTPYRSTFNLNFCSAEQETAAECELPYPALVVKRLSLGDGGEDAAKSKIISPKIPAQVWGFVVPTGVAPGHGRSPNRHAGTHFNGFQCLQHWSAECLLVIRQQYICCCCA